MWMDVHPCGLTHAHVDGLMNLRVDGCTYMVDALLVGGHILYAG